MGVQIPFWPSWLQSQGMSGREIGVLVAVGVWARVVANPLFCQRADRRGERRRPMLRLAWACVAAFALFAVGGGFWWLLMVSVLFGMLFAPLLALGESLTLLSTSADGERYGRIRLWGSLTFIVAAGGSGHLLVQRSPELVFWIVLALLLLLALVCRLLPDVRPSDPHSESRGPIARLLTQPTFLVFLFATSMVQSSHAFYYGFGTLNWLGAGHDQGTIGWLWAEGVIAEIVLFAFGAQVLRRFSPIALISLGAAAGVIRWLALAWSADIGVLLLVQPLHALTYGATHLGAVCFIARRVQPSMSATAQSLYGGVANGLAMGGGTVLAGVLYERIGGAGYGVMAAASALGGVGVVVLARLLRRPEAPS